MYFCATAVTMLAGFYLMANRQRDLFQELLAFGLSSVAGLMCATVILATTRSGMYLYWVCLFATSGAMLTVALPKLIWQSKREQQLTIGFMFRMTAYAACLVTFATGVEDKEMIIGLSGGILVQAIFFYVTIAVCFRFRSIWRWCWVWPIATLLSICFSYLLFNGGDRQVSFMLVVENSLMLRGEQAEVFWGSIAFTLFVVSAASLALRQHADGQDRIESEPQESIVH